MLQLFTVDEIVEQQGGGVVKVEGDTIFRDIRGEQQVALTGSLEIHYPDRESCPLQIGDEVEIGLGPSYYRSSEGEG